MFLFPFACNFPVRNWPFTTVGLIVLNIAIFFAIGQRPMPVPGGELTAAQKQQAAEADYWRLSYGDGLHPEQWVLSGFIHSHSGPLAVNMLFLWVFGLIVEGRLGWKLFLPCYLLLVIGGAAIEQAAMTASSQGVGDYGAAGAIYGLMAIALVWAPKRELVFLYWLLFFFGTVDLPVLMIAAMTLLIDIGWFVYSGALNGDWTGWPHTLGFALGLPIGVLALKQKLVDADGEDVFNAFGLKDVDLSGPDREERASREFEMHTEERHAQILEEGQARLQQFLDEGNSDAALRLYGKLLTIGDGLTLRRHDLVRLIKALHLDDRYSDSAPFMLELAARFPDQANTVRLKLAKLCVTKLQRPARALELVEQINGAELPEDAAALLTKIGAAATQMQEKGVVELDDGGW